MVSLPVHTPAKNVDVSAEDVMIFSTCCEFLVHKRDPRLKADGIWRHVSILHTNSDHYTSNITAILNLSPEGKHWSRNLKLAL